MSNIWTVGTKGLVKNSRLAHWLSQQTRNKHPEKIHLEPINSADDGRHWLRVQRWLRMGDARRQRTNPNFLNGEWQGKPH